MICLFERYSLERGERIVRDWFRRHGLAAEPSTDAPGREPASPNDHHAA